MENLVTPCIYVNKFDNDILANCNIIKEKGKITTFDRIKALEESKRILDLINKAELSETIVVGCDDQALMVLSSCSICKAIVPPGKNSECKLCSEAFCLRHRSEINHSCERLGKDTAKYLNAKNQFKLRLKEMKNKVVR